MSYRRTEPLAWAGWRLKNAGEPPGGQYHGYLAGPSGPVPWQNVWGGTGFPEGTTPSDFVYRSPGEVRPRANASGGANVIRGEQERRNVGYSVVPGDYRNSRSGLGAAEFVPTMPNRMPRGFFGPDPIVVSGGATVAAPTSGPTPTPGPVNTVAQQGPPFGPWSTYRVDNWQNLPISPSPSPTVAATPSNFVPSQGQPLATIAPASASVLGGGGQQFTSSISGVTWSAQYGTITQSGLYTAPNSGVLQDVVTCTNPTNGSTASAVITVTPSTLTTSSTSTTASGTFDIGAWLDSASIIPGVQNLWIAGGAALVLFLLMGRGGKR